MKIKLSFKPISESPKSNGMKVVIFQLYAFEKGNRVNLSKQLGYAEYGEGKWFESKVGNLYFEVLEWCEFPIIE